MQSSTFSQKAQKPLCCFFPLARLSSPQHALKWNRCHGSVYCVLIFRQLLSGGATSASVLALSQCQFRHLYKPNHPWSTENGVPEPCDPVAHSKMTSPRITSKYLCFPNPNNVIFVAESMGLCPGLCLLHKGEIYVRLLPPRFPTHAPEETSPLCILGL